jgi:hypothetical protein
MQAVNHYPLERYKGNIDECTSISFRKVAYSRYDVTGKIF